jgi:hypothetical protein
MKLAAHETRHGDILRLSSGDEFRVLASFSDGAGAAPQWCIVGWQVNPSGPTLNMRPEPGFEFELVSRLSK